MITTENSDAEKDAPDESIITEGNSSDSESFHSSDENENREDTRFKEGQLLRFVRVRFPGNSRSFPFLVGKRRIEYGQKVVAMSDRGMAVGYINSFPYEVPFNKSMLPVRSISKIATDEDIVKDREAYREQKNAENICNDLIEVYKLDMHLTHVEFTSFGKKAVFYFIAPARVDFRELVKDLVARLKTRIELRQISVRDRSASVGGIGPCGLELCCSSFLTKYGNVGIKMAKNQDLTLNFSKLNGVCGQLKCCLQYEDDVYKDKRAVLPKEGDFISTYSGDFGRVDRLHLLSEQFVMMTNRGIRRRYSVSQFKDVLTQEEARFPNEFESISDETHKVVGLEEYEAKKARDFKEELKKLEGSSRSFAESEFERIFGEKTLDNAKPELLEIEDGRTKKHFVPDEEEELTYTPTDDEILPFDDEDDMRIEDVQIRTSHHLRENRSDNRHDRQDRNNNNNQSNHNRQNRSFDRKGPPPSNQDNQRNPHSYSNNRNTQKDQRRPR